MKILESLNKRLSGKERNSEGSSYGITESVVSKIKKGKEKVQQVSTSAITEVALQKHSLNIRKYSKERMLKTYNRCYDTECAHVNAAAWHRSTNHARVPCHEAQRYT